MCEPKGDGISSLEHLLDSTILRARFASFWNLINSLCKKVNLGAKLGFKLF